MRHEDELERWQVALRTVTGSGGNRHVEGLVSADRTLYLSGEQSEERRKLWHAVGNACPYRKREVLFPRDPAGESFGFISDLEQFFDDVW